MSTNWRFCRTHLKLVAAGYIPVGLDPLSEIKTLIPVFSERTFRSTRHNKPLAGMVHPPDHQTWLELQHAGPSHRKLRH